MTPVWIKTQNKHKKLLNKTSKQTERSLIFILRFEIYLLIFKLKITVVSTIGNRQLRFNNIIFYQSMREVIFLCGVYWIFMKISLSLPVLAIDVKSRRGIFNIKWKFLTEYLAESYKKNCFKFPADHFPINLIRIPSVYIYRL